MCCGEAAVTMIGKSVYYGDERKRQLEG